MNASSADISPKVLLADDDALLRKSLAGWLARHGCQCTCASNAADALRLIQTEEFDVLVADINMPGNEQLQFVERAAKLVEAVPLILLTGGPTIETAARSVRLSVFAYLVKPADLEELLSLIRQGTLACRQSRAVRSVRQRIQSMAEELKLIESRLEKSDSAEVGKPMAGFLRAVVGNIASSVEELEKCSPWLEPRQEPGDGLQPLELINAVRHTVGVLERTKQNFKSKDLGQLRQQLNTLLSLHG